MSSAEQVQGSGFDTSAVGKSYQSNETHDTWTVEVEDPSVASKQDDDLTAVYADFPLLVSMIRGEKERKESLKQPYHVKGTDGWIKSTFVINGRAIDNFLLPWVISTVNATVWTVVYQNIEMDLFHKDNTQRWVAVYTIVLNTSLAFLLVFRLNRVAIRYWEARGMWGNVTVASRSLVSGILTHIDQPSAHRDRAIAWVGAFAIATMHFIRLQRDIPNAELAGMLSRDELDKLQGSEHPPLYAARQIRSALKKALEVTTDTPAPLAQAWSFQLNLFETLINSLISQVSGMERIRSTPLPLVYVTHLRTFLIFYLLSLPLIWAQDWGWATIPICALTAFALLGIEGASSECEKPFEPNRSNHLQLDTYCLILLNNIQGLLLQSATEKIEERSSIAMQCSVVVREG